jgi:hypothetical protein
MRWVPTIFLLFVGLPAATPPPCVPVGVENCSLDYEQKWLNRLSYPHEVERMGEKAGHLVPDGLALGTTREDAGSLGTDAHWHDSGQKAKDRFPDRGPVCPPVGPEQGEKSPGGHRA